MNIKTKYNIGDEVWFKVEAGVSKSKILHIDIFVTKIFTSISYNVAGLMIAESQLASTKEELIEML